MPTRANNRRSASGKAIALRGAVIKVWDVVRTGSRICRPRGRGVKEVLLLTLYVATFIPPGLAGSCIRMSEDNRESISLTDNYLGSAT